MSEDHNRKSVYGQPGQRYKHPLGRIVGKPGRRQREGSERLNTNALQKPFEVIVLRDVAERPERQLPYHGFDGGRAASQMDNAISGSDTEPTQDEVDASIDAMRPEVTMLERETFDRLRKELLRSYNVDQLSSYLTSVLGLDRTESDSIRLIPESATERDGHLRRSTWRPGRTPIEKRLSSGTVMKKSEITSNKTKLATQILRLAWRATIRSDEQQLGEMEVSLEDWQLAFLFDFQLDGAPAYRQFIGSSLLRRASEVRPYRPHNIMRITARRQDAEDVARNIQQHCERVRVTELGLNAFNYFLGFPGWPTKLRRLYSQSDLDDIGRRTNTLIRWKDETTLSIYSVLSRDYGHKATDHARRILLSMLLLPSGAWANKSADQALQKYRTLSKKTAQPVLMQEALGQGVPLRLRRLKLGRWRVPALRRPDGTRTLLYHYEVQKELDRKALGAIAHDVNIEVRDKFLPQARKEVPVPKNSSSAYWMPPPLYNDWTRLELQLCRLLEPIADSSMANQSKTNSGDFPASPFRAGSSLDLAQTHLPGINTLLSHFTPISSNAQSSDGPPASPASTPRLIANLTPSPFSRTLSATRLLPTIQLHFAIDANSSATLVGAYATSHSPSLSIPLPAHIADLRLLPLGQIHADLDAMLSDDRVSAWVASLQTSIKPSAASRSNSASGALSAPPYLGIRLPPRLASGKGEPLEDGSRECGYFFEGFESVQTVDLKPRAAAEDGEGEAFEVLKALREKWPEGCVLRYREVEAGYVGGKRAEACLAWEGVESHRSLGPQTAARLVEVGTEVVKLFGLAHERHVWGA